MEHKWETYFDTTSECWAKLQALYAANEQYPKKVVKGRNLHHKFLRSWSKKDKEEVDNDDDNLVSLSEGDHFLAHFYIWKAANKGYRASAALAVRMMYRKSLKYITAEIAEDIAKVWESKEYTHTEETKRKLSEAKKGNQWNKGRHPSEETKKKIAKTLEGHSVSDETRKKLSKAGKGRSNPHTEEWDKKISEAKKGKPSPLKGKPMSEEHKRKIGKANKGKVSNKKGLHWKLVDGKRTYYK